MIRMKSTTDNSIRWLLPLLASFWPIFLFWATNSTYLQNNMLTTSERNMAELSFLQPLVGARQAMTSHVGNAKNALPTITIFYHVFVPKDSDTEDMQDSQSRALNIIRDQLHQVGDSLAAIPNLKSTNLYYTTVGKPLEDGFVNEICKQYADRLRCHHLKHLEEGFEEYTLTQLYDHCQEHTDHRVLYLHTKGSFHARASQHRVREHVTDAVTSRDCIEQAHKEDCDLCGLLFLPRPSLHFTGNMFNAKCSYIQKLLSPMDFQNRMTHVVAKGQKMLEDEILVANMHDVTLVWNNGLGRYAMEHWHGSHPSLQKICDVSTHYEIEYWKRLERKDRRPEDWELGVFPRHPHTADWSYGKADELIHGILNHESRRKREYFLLPGQLLRWYELYKEFPPDSSWVWPWYPDGQFWKFQVAMHGERALEVAAQELD